VKLTGMGYEDPSQARLWQIIQQQLKGSGINLSFTLPQVATSAQDFFVNKTTAIACSAWTGRPDPSQTATELLAPTSFYNAGAYAPPGMVSALAAASQDQSSVRTGCGTKDDHHPEPEVRGLAATAQRAERDRHLDLSPWPGAESLRKGQRLLPLASTEAPGGRGWCPR